MEQRRKEEGSKKDWNTNRGNYMNRNQPEREGTVPRSDNAFLGNLIEIYRLPVAFRSYAVQYLCACVYTHTHTFTYTYTYT